MGRPTRYTQLPDQPYDPRITDINNPVRPPTPSGTVTLPNGQRVDQFRNRNRRNTTPIQLVGGAPSIRVLPANPLRTGLIIQNKDSAATLFVSYGSQADVNSLQIAAGGNILEDFTCPKDEVYLFSVAANIQVVIIETSRGA